MAKQSASESSLGLSPENRIARLLGLLVIKDIEQQSDQVAMLRAAGFDIAEIADMLGVTSNYVSVAIYQSRAKKKRRKTVRGKNG